jgi:hypothetical protein
MVVVFCIKYGGRFLIEINLKFSIKAYKFDIKDLGMLNFHAGANPATSEFTYNSNANVFGSRRKQFISKTH